MTDADRTVTGPARRALVVRGGWDGHVPVEATDRFNADAIGFLDSH